MKLPRTYFQQRPQRDLLVSNSIYQCLGCLEDSRKAFHPKRDFPQRRFQVLWDFVKAKKRFDPDRLEESVLKPVDKEQIDKNYEDLRTKLSFEREKVVLDHLYAGSSFDEILVKENISLEDMLLSFRKIEACLKENYSPDLQFKAFAQKALSNLDVFAEPRRRVLELLATGYVNSEIEEISSKKRTSISNDLTLALKTLGITRNRYEKEQTKLKTLNFDDKARFFFDSLFHVFDDQERAALLKHCGTLDKAYQFTNRFLLLLSALQRQVLIRRIWGISQKQIAKDLGLKPKQVDSAFEDGKKKLRQSVKDFFRIKDQIPNGLDPVRFLSLTHHQAYAIRHYLQGKSKAQLMKLCKVKNQTSVDDYLRDGRRKLRLSQKDLENSRSQYSQQKIDPDLNAIKIVFPEMYSCSVMHPDTIKNLQQEISIVLNALDDTGEHMTKYFRAYAAGQKYKDIASSYGVDIKVVTRSVNRVKAKIQESYCSELKHKCPDGANLDRWRLLSPENQKILLAHLEGKSKSQIIEELALDIKANSLYPRIDRMLKKIGLLS